MPDANPVAQPTASNHQGDNGLMVSV